MKIKMIALNLVLATSLSSSAFAAGGIVGTVKFDGDAPVLSKINMAADPKCVANNTGDVLPEILVLGEGKTVANVLVKITKGQEAIAVTPATTPVVIDQKGCKYFPHVIGVQKDQPIKILNSDGTLHNVHIQAIANGEHNEAMPAFRKELTKTFTQVETAFPVKCDVHPWMKSFVEVFDHPFFAVTMPDGKFKISGLDAGAYELTVWHEKLGTQTFNVTVAEGADTTQDVMLTKPAGTAKLDSVLITNWK